LQELFATQFVGLDGSADPCAGFTITATDVGCLAQGLRIGQRVQGNPAGQYNALLGGTPTLTPEKATTKSVGVILEPRFLKRFSLTVDYFDIKVGNAIQAFGSDAIVNTCFTTQNPIACNLIQRNPVSGSLWLDNTGFIRNLQQNIGGVRTKGIDVNAAYSLEIGDAGTVSLGFVGTYLDSFVVDNGLSTPYDCAGYYGSTCSNLTGTPSAPSPRWKHKARISFNTPGGVGISGQWRRIGAVKIDFSSANPSLTGAFDAFSAKLPVQNYFDLATTFRFADKFTFRLGVNNLLDRQPPLVTSGRADGTRSPCPSGPCNGNTYPAVYDALGRYLYAGVTLDF
jgi:iron complex outermembrane recepter protein